MVSRARTTGAQVEVAHRRYDAAWIDAERTRCADVEVLVFNAKDHVDQRAPVGHVVEAAARIPAAVVAHDAVSGAGRVANTGNGRAMRVLDMGRGKAPAAKTSNRSHAYPTRAPAVTRSMILCWPKRFSSGRLAPKLVDNFSSKALPRRFGCNLSATRNVIRASGRAIPELRLCSRVSAA